jgi:hypothetical protein
MHDLAGESPRHWHSRACVHARVARACSRVQVCGCLLRPGGWQRRDVIPQRDRPQAVASDTVTDRGVPKSS